MMRCWKFSFLLMFAHVITGGHSQGPNESPMEYELIMPPMPPTIFAQASSGVQVTFVRARKLGISQPFNPRNSSRVPTSRVPTSCFPQYFLYQDEQTDYDRFSINLCTGKIATSRYVEKSEGETFKLIVLARDERGATLATREINILVTTYNSKPPSFTRKHYTDEVLDSSELHLLIVSVSAKDDDTVEPNQRVYFSLQDPFGPQRNPWIHPVTSPIMINSTSGEIHVTGSLMDASSPIRYRLCVSDGGSPQRLGTAKLTLYVRNMSAPRNVRVHNITENSLDVCWSMPLRGTPEGYLVSYNIHGPIRGSHLRSSKGKLNYTIDQLETRIEDPPEPFQISDLHELPGSSQGEIPVDQLDFFNRRFCTSVDGLAPHTTYTISVRAWASQGRMSMARMPLMVQTQQKNCNESTCAHGLCQEKIADPGFVCHCSPGYHGERCHLMDGCALNGSSSCLNGGTCVRSRASHDSNGYECHCPQGYFGPYCQGINPCLAQQTLCSNGGSCLVGPNGTFYCRCSENFTGRNCELDSSEPTTPPLLCEADRTNSPEGVMDWPPTSVGSTAFLSCPFGLLQDSTNNLVQVEISSDESSQTTNYGYTQLNSLSTDLTTTDETPSLSADDELETDNLFQRSTRSLRSLYGASRTCSPVSEGDLGPRWLPPDLSSCRTDEEEIDEIVNVTSASSNANATVLASSVRKITNLVNRAVADHKVAQKMVSAISHILDVNDTMIDQTNQESPNATDNILASIHEYTANVPLQPGEKVIHRAKNLVVEAQLLRKDNLPEEVTFNPFPSNDDESSPNPSYSDKTINMKERLWITVPKAALENATLETIRFQFISFKNGRIFRGKNGTKTLNHRVVSATIENVPRNQLSSPIKYMVPIQQLDPMLVLPTCVFWNAEDREWSDYGLKTRQNKKGEVFCESDHMTSFSVLLDPIGTPIVSEAKPALSIITYIGIALSTVALVVTVLTFSVFSRSMNRDRSGPIVMNLALALLLLNIAFIGSLFITSEHVACVVFGALLHYAVTASFSWMLIEAVNMYQLLVTVFPSSETHFIRKRVILGWGVPLLFVVIALIWDRHVYFTEYQSVCVISSTVAPAVYYTTYLAPICVVLFINFVVFLRVLLVLCQSRPTYKRSTSVTLTQIRGAIAIVTLLGITWLLGMFAVGQFRMVFQFMFCLTTPFQGMIIFWVRVMQSVEARMAWKSFAATGSTRSRPRPLSSVRTNSSSHNSSSPHTRSSGLASSSSQKSSFVSAFKAAGRGFMSSSKMRYKNNPSKDSSTKKLKNQLSNETTDKQTTVSSAKPPQAVVNSQSPIDNQYRRLSHRTSQESSASGLSNGKVLDNENPIVKKDNHLLDGDPITLPYSKIEEESLKDLFQMVNDHPSFQKEKEKRESKLPNGYKDSIFSNLRNSFHQNTSLKLPKLDKEKTSVSLNNLRNSNQPQTSLSTEEAEISVGSRRPIVYGFGGKNKKSGKHDKNNFPNQKDDNDYLSSHNKHAKGNDIGADFNIDKSLSDTEISGSVLLSSEHRKRVPSSKHSNKDQDDVPETQFLTDVVPLDNFKKMSLTQKASSDENISPFRKVPASIRKKSVSSVELDCSDYEENPQENLLSR